MFVGVEFDLVLWDIMNFTTPICKCAPPPSAQFTVNKSTMGVSGDEAPSYALQLRQHCFNFANFNTLTINLNLKVHTTKEIQSTIS